MAAAIRLYAKVGDAEGIARCAAAVKKPMRQVASSLAVG